MYRVMLGSIYIWMCVCVMSAFAQQPLITREVGAGMSDPRAFCSDGGNEYLATRHELYRRGAESAGWRPLYALGAGENEILSLGGARRLLFVGTRQGLVRSVDGGRSWQNVFKTADPVRNEIVWIEVPAGTEGSIMIGTGSGVFASDDEGSTWKDISANLRNRRVSCLAEAAGRIYACAEDGLFGTDPADDGWERLWGRDADVLESGSLEQDMEPEDDEKMLPRPAGYIAHAGDRLLLGQEKHLLYSDDAGQSWLPFPSAGIAGNVTCILPSSRTGRIYCATTEGIFLFEEGSENGEDLAWRQLYRGSGETLLVRDLVYGDTDETILWAVTERGLYRLEWVPEESGDMVFSERRFRLHAAEPTLKELQSAAMKFADVEPQKTRNWQVQSRLKALLPKVSLGMDSGRSTTYEIYTSSTKDYYVLGPDDITEGWDVSFSWELSDLIWSTDQTSIDVRARLTTQLRNDILDDLRRSYFERRRLQYELAAVPPQDAKLLFEKELRIEELTQAIDDLTGNALSEYLSVSAGRGARRRRE